MISYILMIVQGKKLAATNLMAEAFGTDSLAPYAVRCFLSG